ncbi:hypothetical protein N0V93_007444 [Gnomoniopsis smithogilvyi]|uniref:SigF-like NTF2-like domain-containing protein n=1 Tax=Gnomoniopsis smithogilvyi TaxID=1191159 RepID=A0A9W8YRL9_9PEZI|nr:hypothetical protein N0V93_007444 [Gnomoniopsis smithogilvyi]
MENPDQEIRAVVRSLCQGTPDEQQRTIQRYFTKDASFVHPFCVVPHFHERRLPFIGAVSSRDVVRGIFQWYRMLSPKIEIEIDTALHDTARDKIYLDIRQIFSIWFVPLYAAHVRLVTVLDLVSNEDPDYHDPLDRILKLEDATEADEKKALQHQSSTSTIDHHDARTWKIHKQEDLYQVNEFLKFTGTSLLAYAWALFQLGASLVCVFMALFVRVSPWAFQEEPARGGIEATIQQIDTSHNDDDDASKAGGKAVAGTSAGWTSGDDSHSTNGNRRGSANSKASPSTQKKPWKNGAKKNGR